MIDVGDKPITKRTAVATGRIHLCTETMDMIRRGDSPKGNILAIAEVAGIMAAKNTPSLLPLCHPLAIDAAKVRFEIGDSSVQVFCEVTCHGKTGVEMEALVGANAALLTVYDLAKAVDPAIDIDNIYLLSKEGGKSGLWKHPKVTSLPQRPASPAKSPLQTRCAILTLSDRAAKGEYHDQSGPILAQWCLDQGASLHSQEVIPDDKSTLQRHVLRAIEMGAELILLTGGTGIGSRDISPEAVAEIAAKELSGFGEAQRLHGSKFTKSAWLSRSTAFVVGPALVVLFPGNPKAVTQGLEAVGPLFAHALKMIKGGNHD
jgi:molybdenum cofactor biosynthesis protein MoaC